MYQADRIAILMATYNGERYISEQIESIINQSYQKWELFIHDDGSTDKTCLIVDEYCKRYPQKIHRLSGTSTGGAKNNFFFLMNNVEAPYVMFCDQDDVWLHDKIEKTFKRMKMIEKNNGASVPTLVFSDLKVVDHKLNVISERMSELQKLNPQKIKFKDVLIQNVVTGCTTMINRACLKKAVVDCDIDRIIMHDWWCALIAASFGVVSFIDEALILYRQHGNNSVGAKALMSLRYLVDRIYNFQEIRESLVLTQKQASAFAATFNLEDKNIAKQYGLLGTKRKIDRLAFYIRNAMFKSGLIRNIGLLFWG